MAPSAVDFCISASVIPALASLLVAQTPYITTQYSEPITPLAGGTLVLGPGAFFDEARLVPIGFTFRFYDVAYSNVIVGENGAIYFANTCAQGCFPSEFCNAQNLCETTFMPAEFSGMPSTSEPNRMIAAFWDDLYIEQAAPASEIRYALRGNAPNRELVIEWRNIRHYPSIFLPDSRVSFQIRLEEGTNTIRLHYGPYSPGQSNVEWSGIIGIENTQGTEATYPIPCGANATCNWVDLNTLNNQVLQIAIPNAPELSGTVGAPRGSAPGVTARFPVTVRNIGLQPTGVGFSTQIYLSTDRNIVPGVDPLLGTLNFGALGAGQTATATLTVTTPNLSQAYYTVGAVIDSANAINEPVESNNTALAPNTFLVGRDLSAQFGGHPGLPPGQSATVMFDLINESSAQPNVAWRVYLSADTIRDASDVLLASGTINAPAGTDTPISANVSVPSVSPGTYRLIAVIDPNNAIAEIDEFDNEIASGPVLIGPDLAIVDVRGPPESGAGASIPLTIGVLNPGASVSVAEVEVYLSLDRVLDASDALVFTGTVSATYGTTDAEVVGRVPAALSTGEYMVFARIDPSNVITEVDETNNTYTGSGSIRLIGPDVAAVTVDVPDPAFHGQPYRMRGTIENTGGTPLSGFYAAFYLSANELITISDPVLAEVGPLDLEPGETLDVEQTIVFPNNVASGEYFIAIVADSRDGVAEDREIDNVRRTRDTVTVRDIAPDLVSSEIILPRTAGSGESFWVQRAMENIGNEAGSADYLIFLVVDGTSVREAVIGRASIALGPGELDQGADLVTVPASVQPGDYRVEYVLDPEETLAELDEENNTSMSTNPVTLEPAQLAIVGAEPSLAVIGVPYRFDLVARGGTGPISWSLIQGALPDGLSFDPVSGSISGVPTTIGIAYFGIRVSDGALFHERAFAIRVIPPTTELRLITRSIPPAFVGAPYDFPCVAIGGVEPYNWIVDPKLPEGLALTADGHIAGTTSTVAEALVYTFTVVDATGNKDDTLIAFRVLARDRSVRFDQAALPDGIVGEPYDAKLTAVGGLAPYTFAVASGELPLGLAIANGRIVGLPAEAGTFIFELSVTDDAKDTDRNLYVVRVEPSDRVRFVTRSLPPGSVGVPYLDADGGPVQVRAITPGSTSSVSYALFNGTLPPGLSLGGDGTISGSPTEAGVFAFISSATDPVGEIDFRAFGIVVEGDPMTDGMKDGCGCNASGGRSSLAWMWLLVAIPLVLRNRRWLGAMFAVLISSSASAQTSTPYFISESTEAYALRSGGQALSPFNFDDGQATAVLPFPFRFFDQFYSTMEVGTNGYVTFDVDGSNLGNQVLPDPNSPNNLIALFWDDLISPSMTFQVEGAEPNRIAIVQWEQTYRFGSNGVERMSMQLWLYEGLSGLFEIHYGPMTNTQGAFFDGTVGFEDQSGIEAYTLRSCSPACTGLDVEALDGITIRALQDAGEDLFAGWIEPEVRGDPIRVYQAVPFQVESHVTSYHTDPIGPFRYAIHLADTDGDLIVPAVFTSTAITLGPYEDRGSFDAITLPLSTPPGRYRLALVVDPDDAIAEPSENNNVVVSRLEIIVGERRPDFAVGTVGALTPTAQPGGSLDVQLELSNAGNLQGATSWRVVLSGNSAASVDDVLGAASTNDQTLDVGQVVLLDTTIAIPADLTPGLYYVGVVVDADNAVTELLEVNNDAVSEVQIQIGQGTLQIETDSLPPGLVGLEYGATLSASGGTGEYEWEVAGGTLPDGLALDPRRGILLGVPGVEGTSSVTFRVISGTAVEEATLELVIAPIDGPLTIVTHRLVPGFVGLEYPPRNEEEQRIIAVGGAGPATFTVTAGSPPGLTLDADGVLHGVPTTPGEFSMNVEAFDGTDTVSREIPVTIAEPGRLTLIGEQLPNATFQEAYAHQLVVTGSTPLDPPVFNLIAGELPAGLLLSGSGEITGAPEAAGDFVFNIEIRETASGAKDTATFYLKVAADDALVVTPGTLPIATLNQAYEAVLTAEGGTDPIRWVIDYAEELPRGLMEERVEIDGTTKFRIFGTPEEIPETGVVGILVKAEDGAGRVRKVAYALQVVEASATPADDDGGCGCTSVEDRDHSGAWLSLLVLLLMVPRCRARFRAALLFLAVGACDCGDDGKLTELRPELIAPERIDFGDVGLGIEVEQSFVLRNDGDGTLKISSKKVDADLEDFRISSLIPEGIAPKTDVEVRVAFTPIQLGESTATLTIVADDELGTHTIALVGKGVVPGIEVAFSAPPCSDDPNSLSFGRVTPGTMKTVPLQLRAIGTQPVAITSARIAENASAEFSLETVEEGTAIAPGDTLALDLTYAPADTGPDTAAVIFETDATGSRTVRIAICGEGAAPTLCGEPLDLGRVPLGTTASGTLVVTNCSADPVEVTGVSISSNPASDPAYSIGTLSKTPPATLDPNDTVEVEVRLTAESLGTKEGYVQVVSTAPETPNVFFPVTANVADTCGIDVIPDQLVFQDVLVGASERRNVLIANAGTDPCAVTKVEITSGGSAFTLRDPFAVPLDLDPGFSNVLVVRYEPTLPGATDIGVLEISSGTRVHRVDLLGNPPMAAGCQLDVTPSFINWGTVPPGDSVIRQVEIENIGTEECTINDATLDPSSSPSFVTVATQRGPLPAGMKTTAIVTFRSPARGTATGLLHIDTSDVDSPIFDVGLFGATASPGICVLPRDLDFGMTMNGIETFRIWACGANPVTVTDLTFSRPDDEFTFDAPPALPAILQPNEEVSVTVHYTSADDVGDSAVITVGSDDPVEPLIRVNVVAGPVIVPPSAGRYLYFWQIDSFGGNESNIMRLPLQGAPLVEPFWGPLNGKPCSGCHGVSPDGRYVSLIEATSFSMQIVDTQTNTVVALPFQAPNAAYVSWRPDPNTTPPYQFVYDDGDRIHVASVTDGYIGELPGANDPNYGSKMASWGSNGMIAFARGQIGGGWGLFGPADIMLIDEAGGAPVPLLGASINGAANYYPAYHPNGQWIAFTQSVNAQGTISAPDATIKLVATDQSGTVLDLPILNCAVNTCGSSFPTWSNDGEFLSFSSNRAGGAGGWDMYISDIDPITGDAMPAFNLVDANTAAFEHAARWSD
jgi:subtilase family serine protease